MRVDIFQLNRKDKFAALDFFRNRCQARYDLGSFVGRQHSDLSQHPSMRLAGGDIVTREPLIESDRFREGFNAAVGVAAETSTPSFVGHDNSPPLSDAPEM